MMGFNSNKEDYELTNTETQSIPTDLYFKLGNWAAL